MAFSAEEIEPALLQRLGLVVKRWAQVEAYEGEFLSFLVSGDPGAMQVITQSVSGATMTDWLRTLSSVRFTDENTLGGLKILFTRIDQTRSERNALVHGLWVSVKDSPGMALVQTIRWDRSEVVKHEVVTRPDLDELAEAIKEIVDELVMIGGKLGFPKKRDTPVKS